MQNQSIDKCRRLHLIDIGQRFSLGEGEELKAFYTAGFLGNEYGPFLIPDPSEGLESVKPPVGMDIINNFNTINDTPISPAPNRTDNQ